MASLKFIQTSMRKDATVLALTLTRAYQLTYQEGKDHGTIPEHGPEVTVPL